MFNHLKINVIISIRSKIMQPLRINYIFGVINNVAVYIYLNINYNSHV